MFEVFLNIFYIFVFFYIIRKYKFFEVEGLSKGKIRSLFILKVLVGILLAFIYTYYYTDRKTADIFKYFDDSKVMYNALFTNPIDYFKMMTGIGNNSAYFDNTYYKVMNNWYRVYESNLYNDSHTIIRFNAFIRIFSFGFYSVHNLVMCFLALVGLLALYKNFSKLIENRKKELVLAIFLMPSVLLWTSGVLKEGLLIFGMGMLIYHCKKLLMNQSGEKLWSIFWIVISSVLLFYIKFYIIFTLIPLGIAYFWVEKTNNKLSFVKYLTVLVVFIFAGFNIQHVFPGYNLIEMLVRKQQDFIGLASSLKSGSYITISELQPNILSFLKNVPEAFSVTFFRPFLFEAKSLMMIPAALENLFILLIAALSLIFIKTEDINKNTFWFCIFLTLLIFILIGLTTPVLGAVVRYKAPVLPFLVIVFVMLYDKDKLIKKLPFMKFLK